MNFRKANMNHEGSSTLEEIFLSLKQLKSTVQVKTVETEEMFESEIIVATCKSLYLRYVKCVC